MIGEWNIVQVVVLVVGIERAPGAVFTLHAVDHSPRAREARIEILAAGKNTRSVLAMATTAVSSTSG